MAARGNNGDRSALAMFAAELRAARTKSGLTRDELGARLNYSGSLVSLVETMARVPTLEFARRLDEVLGTPGTFERMQEHLRAAPFPAWFRDWLGAEREAISLRSFEPLVVPGLLQTEDYARAVLRTRVKVTDEEIDEMVSARIERQSILAQDKPPMLWSIVDEGVLRRPVGGRGTMAGQVLHLAGMSQRPNVVVQVIPAGAGAHEGLRGGAFMIADFGDAPSAAYQDTAARGQIIEYNDDLISLTVLWETLKAEALPRSASLELIQEVAATWTD